MDIFVTKCELEMTRDHSIEWYWFIYKEIEDSLEKREASKDTIENVNTNALKDNNKALTKFVHGPAVCH